MSGTKYRAKLLDLALKSGAVLTGKPDGSESITVVFSIDAWRNFDHALLRSPSMNIMQALNDVGINPFAVTLLAESVLKSPIAELTVNDPKQFFFPVNRSDCAGWAGVKITVEAVPTPRD